MIYLDNAATTKLSDTVYNAMLPYLLDRFGNPGSVYRLGRNAATGISSARSSVAKLLGCRADDIIFTSGGSEANSLAICGVADYLKKIGKTHIIVSKVEHESVLRSAEYMHSIGFSVTYLPVNSHGVVSVSDLKSMIKHNTGLVSIMFINNETGAINPVKEIADLCNQRGILFHTDCVQAAGTETICAPNIGCDFLSISSHKIHGPKGAGCLYAADKSILTPRIFGGSDQEFGLRGGTENVPAIVGFGAACELLCGTIRESDILESVLKQKFYEKLKNELESYGLGDIIHINGELIKHGRIINLYFDGVDGETLILALDSRGVYVSAGSACRSHESEPSYVLLAMGVDPENARNSIRVSFSSDNTIEEIGNAAHIVAECVHMLHSSVES